LFNFNRHQLLFHGQNMNDERKLIKFNASTGFSVVLEFGNNEVKTAYEVKIKNAGLKCETIKDFNLNFDNADLFMDMRSPECREQFDLDDWI
jgi:hypothetical protein